MPQQRKKKERSERLRGERDQIKCIERLAHLRTPFNTTYVPRIQHKSSFDFICDVSPQH